MSKTQCKCFHVLHVLLFRCMHKTYFTLTGINCLWCMACSQMRHGIMLIVMTALCWVKGGISMCFKCMKPQEIKIPVFLYRLQSVILMLLLLQPAHFWGHFISLLSENNNLVPFNHRQRCIFFCHTSQPFKLFCCATEITNIKKVCIFKIFIIILLIIIIIKRNKKELKTGKKRETLLKWT